MSLHKKLRNLVNKFKDKASVIAASLSLKRHVSSVKVHVLRATTHTLSAPPPPSSITTVISSVQGCSYLLSRTCIDTLIDRLHRTRSATVALKCLFTLHNIVLKGPVTLKDNLFDNNALNLATFRDNTDVESLQLSFWIRWYANVLEHILTVSRIKSNKRFLCEIRSLVDFVEAVSHAPRESLHLQRIELVYNVVGLVCEDYGRVQREISRRVVENEERMGDLEVEEVRELVGCIKRLEECREKLGVLFVNKKRNDAFWVLIERVRNKGLVMIEEVEGKWMTVVKGTNELAESTRYTNPFLEPGEFIYSDPTGWRVATWQLNRVQDNCSNGGVTISNGFCQ